MVGDGPTHLRRSTAPAAERLQLPEISIDSNGKCSTSEKWTCNGGLYELQCNCWSQTCECYGNGDKMVAFGFEGCPSCTLGSDVIAKCPFPH